MRVEELYHEGTCDECDSWTTVFEIYLSDGTRQLKLCRKCLMELLKAIVER